MHKPRAARNVCRTAGALCSFLLVVPPAFAEADGVTQALDILLSQQPAPTDEWQDSCADPGETRVYKLPPTPQLERLMRHLLDDPFVMPMESRGVSVVLLAKPLPCGERLLGARVELWDSLALKRRSGTTRFFYRMTDWLRSRDPALWEIVFPDDGVADKARVGYRLTRVLKFGRGSPWLGTMNGIGVVVFPLASNTISGATLTFKTEKRVVGKRGKKMDRIVTRQRTGSIALPGPEEPHASPEQIRSSLGMRRPPQ